LPNTFALEHQKALLNFRERDVLKMTVDDTFPPSIWSTIINDKVKKAPSQVFCEIHEENWRETGTRKITYAQFARAVNRACWWLEDQFGPSKNFDSFTYVGDNDLRYTIAMVAAQKSQRKVCHSPHLAPFLICSDVLTSHVDGHCRAESTDSLGTIAAAGGYQVLPLARRFRSPNCSRQFSPGRTTGHEAVHAATVGALARGW
jgi:hypothetical protein